MMNKTQEEPSASPISAHMLDDVLDSDSEDEQEDKLKSIYALRGGAAANNDAKAKDKVNGDNQDDDDDEDDEENDDEENEDDDKLLEKLHVNTSLYDELSSFLSRSERAHEKPDVPPSKEALARRRVTILVDQEQQPSGDDKTVENIEGPVGITVYIDTEPMTVQEMKDYFMQPEDFRRCGTDVAMTTIRWNKAQKLQMKWDENENTIRGMEEYCYCPPVSKKGKKSKKTKNAPSSSSEVSRADLRYNHCQTVLAEVVRQKMENGSGGMNGGKPYNDEKIRLVSIKHSEPFTQSARQLGQQDEEEVAKMNPRWKKTTSILANKNFTASSKGGKRFFSFLQRNSSKK